MKRFYKYNTLAEYEAAKDTLPQIHIALAGGVVYINGQAQSDSGGSGGCSKWSGHADAAGLKEIGWDDEDIAYYQEYGVNWSSEDDDAHKVSDFDKWYAQQVTKSNYNSSNLRTKVQYFPKVSFFSGMTTIQFQEFHSLIAIPFIDTSSVTSASQMFYNCRSLTCIPPIDVSKATSTYYMFYNCYALKHIPLLSTSNVSDMRNMFQACRSLESIPMLDTAKVTKMSYMFYDCSSLSEIPCIDTSSVTEFNYMFYNCFSLAYLPPLDMGNATRAEYMCAYCNSLKTLHEINVSKITNTSYFNNILYGCQSIIDTETGIFTSQTYYSSAPPPLSGKSLIAIINNARSITPYSLTQTLFMSLPAAKYVYEYSCSDDIEPWMDKNDGSKSAQVWLAAQAAKTTKPHSTNVINLSFASGSSNYSG